MKHSPLSIESSRTNDEFDRLAALVQLDLLDSSPEKEFNDLVRLASAVCNAPIGLVSLVDANRLWFKASFGIGTKESPRDISFCTQAIQQSDVFVVEDATHDDRFSDSPLVTGDPSIRFYAGTPLRTPNGFAVGTLCVIDRVARHLTESQKDALIILGAQVEARMELRLKQKLIARSQLENEKLYGALKATSDLFERFMTNGPFASYIKDADGKMVFYNRFLAQHFGVTEQAWIGKTDHDLWPLKVAEDFRRNDLAVLEGGVPVEIEEASPGENGVTSYWKSIKFPYQGADGNLMLAGMSVDVTHQVIREAMLQDALRDKSKLGEKLQAREHLMQKFMEHSPNTMFVKDDCGRYVFYNDEFAKCVGIDRTEWLGRPDDEFFPKQVADRYRAQDLQVMEAEHALEFNDEVTHADGTLHQFRTMKFTYKDEDGRKLLAGVTADVTEQVKREKALREANLQLELLSTTDSLTALFNRRFFESRAAVEFSNAKRRQRPLSVLVMDIDNFKRRNDTYGHAAGDVALQAVGRIMNGCVRMGDIAARLGGEEFGFLLPDTDASGANVLAFRIQTALSQQLEGSSHSSPLTVSVGVSSLTEEIDSWERLLCKADDAMYEAKRSGKNRVVDHDSLFASAIQPPSTPTIYPEHPKPATPTCRDPNEHGSVTANRAV
jgi:diguanylate cyclase (GGDEF)-like protein/PAS domain S-box-containing protein